MGPMIRRSLRSRRKTTLYTATTVGTSVSQSSAAGKLTDRGSQHPLLRSRTLTPLLVLAALAGTLALSTTPAFANNEVEATLCGGVQPAGGGVIFCAEVNPHGTTVTKCTFQYGETLAYGYAIPCSPAPPYAGEDPIQVTATATGLEANTTYHYRVAVTNQNGKMYGPDEMFTTPPVAPVVEDVSASGITDDNAAIEAQIDPVNSETEYEVVLADPCAGPPGCIRDVSLANGKIPATTGHETINVELASKEHLEIEPGTTYSYWVVAKNSDDQTTKVEKTFKTLDAPVIESESVSGVTEHDATLEAQINTYGVETTYRFQIAKSPACLPRPPLPPGYATAEPVVPCLTEEGSLPSGLISGGLSGDQHVSVDLATAGMAPESGATYRFTVVATQTGGGSVYGPEQSFTTPAPPPSTGGGQGGGTDTGTVTVICPENVATPPACAIKDLPHHKPPKPLTRAEKLKKALKACKKDKRYSKRTKCEAKARKQFGSVRKKGKGKRK